MKNFLSLLPLALAGASAMAADFGSDDLVRQGRVVYERSFTPAEQERVKPLIVAGMNRVAEFYGQRKGALPDFLFCKSAACARYVGGSEWRSFTVNKGARRWEDGQYWFERPTIVINALARQPQASDEHLQSVLAHELAHVELYARAGGTEKVPAWFNEGLASIIGDIRCQPGSRGVDDLAKLAVSGAWIQHTRPSGGLAGATYCQAGMEVLAWIERRGGAQAVLDLLAGLSKKSFESQYGAFVTAQGEAINTAGAEDNDH